MIELNTLGPVIKVAYEGQNNTNAFTDQEKIDLANLLLASLIPEEQKGKALGVATLDATGTVPMSQLNISALIFKGAWNAATNTPALLDGTGIVGDFYKVSVPGTFNFGNGNYTFAVGDWVMFAAGVWQRIGVHEAVMSVNGKLGAVVLNAADVGAATAAQGAKADTAIQSVNNKTGTVILTAADVGALPSTYTPPVTAWNSVTGKPDFPTLYQKKQRGSIGPAIPACLLNLTSNTNIPNIAYTPLVWSEAVYDQFAIWNGNSGIVIPSWAKYVRVTGCVSFVANSTGSRQATVYKNGAAMKGLGLSRGAASATGVTNRLFTSGVMPVVAGDVLACNVYQSSGGILIVEHGTPSMLTWMQVELFE